MHGVGQERVCGVVVARLRTEPTPHTHTVVASTHRIHARFIAPCVVRRSHRNNRFRVRVLAATAARQARMTVSMAAWSNLANTTGDKQNQNT
jgi:hypothetical protein